MIHDAVAFAGGGRRPLPARPDASTTSPGCPAWSRLCGSSERPPLPPGEGWGEGANDAAKRMNALSRVLRQLAAGSSWPVWVHPSGLTTRRSWALIPRWGTLDQAE